MGLGRYRAKRDFRATPEPAGKQGKAKATRAFVVQEHHARRHHFDFRLEHEGVLKSWAVPKGPSMTPGDRRLAVEVEDHPLDYGSFEGAIPEGHYGAGTVALWDRGTWTPEGDVDEGLAAGTLKFRLDGQKLVGRFALVRIKPKAGEEPPKQPPWLLLKEKSDVSPDAGVPLSPALATLVDHPPGGSGWVFEPKFDGYRLIAEKKGKKVRLLTRSGQDWTDRFPTIEAAIRKLPGSYLVLDGEACVLDPEGRASFESLVASIHSDGRGIVFFVFDLLGEEEKNLAPLPLRARKGRLKELMAEVGSDTLRYVEHVAADGPTFLEAATRLGFEGAIAKRIDAPYAPGRTDAWRKIKIAHRQEVILCGYTESEVPGRPFSALLAAVYADEELRFAGKIGTGFSAATLRDLKKRLTPLAVKKPPVVNPPREPRAHWVRPELVAEVAFREWTQGGHMRHPSFLGLREDKPAENVVRERPVDADEDEPVGAAPSRKGPRPVARLTNEERVLDPETGLTKRHLAAYYAAIAPHFLAYGARRPLALVRCPDGLGGQTFFQKKKLPGMSDDIHEAKKGDEHLLFVSDAGGLAALAQFSTLELHGWGAPLARVEEPDVLVMDLDPDEGLPWERVVKAALELREALGTLGVASWIKTTGGKGLHVTVPLARGHDWPFVSAFAEALARHFAERAPEAYVATMSKAARKGRIFIDHLRNRRGSTAVLPYSPRARPGLTVAMPVAWSGLLRVDPKAFTIETVPKLVLDRKKDPWEGFLSSPQHLPRSAVAKGG